MKLSQNKIIILIFLMAAITCFFAVYLRLFTEKELWYEMFAAILGVIITAVITMVLLKGQTTNDVERERAAKVFEEKLRIYQEYLQILCNVIEDRCLSDEEKIRLEFQTSYVAMHCEPKYIVDVSNSVKKIIEYVCPDDVDTIKGGNRGSDSPDALLDNLFNIVEAFRKDLYGSDFRFDDKCRLDTLENFSNAYRNARSETTGGSSIEMPVNAVNSVDVQPAKNGDKSLWEGVLPENNNDGWHISEITGDSDLTLTASNDNPGRIHIGYKDGRYYMSAAYQNDSDFAKPLKWEKGGRQRYGLWWKFLDNPYCDIPFGELAEKFSSDVSAGQYIKDNVAQLTDVLSRHHKTVLLKNKVGAYSNWKIFVWYWDILACEFTNQAEGTPYMDIAAEGEKYVISFGNRNKDISLLRRTLSRIGAANISVGNDSRVILDEIDSKDIDAVGARIKYWIEKISC